MTNDQTIAIVMLATVPFVWAVSVYWYRYKNRGDNDDT